MRPVNAHMDLVAANKHGQQLYFADMAHRPGSAALRRPKPPPAVPAPIRPVRHRQLTLFTLVPDLRAGREGRYPEPPNPQHAHALTCFIAEHGARHGWGKFTVETTRRGVEILLGIQDTPGAPIKISEVHLLKSIRKPMLPILEVLDAAGMLEDDQVPPIAVWYARHTAPLPQQMRAELDIWLDVMLNGSRTAPRRRPRSAKSVRAHFRPVLPLLQDWTAAGHTSLREITREHLLAAIPRSGPRRKGILAGSRSIFGILKARKVIFQDPTVHIRTTGEQPNPPTPVELRTIREALASPNLARAAIAALVAFHALRGPQLQRLLLTDIRDGHLHLEGRVIPLAEPVKARLSAYLDYRNTSWPRTANPHFFLTRRTAGRTRPPSDSWIHKTLAAHTQAVREDRILNEANATGGDIRRLCDLFGLSVSGANRYVATIEHPDLAQPPASS